MAEEKPKPESLNLTNADDMVVLNVLMHNVKGINGVSTAPVFEPAPDNY